MVIVIGLFIWAILCWAITTGRLRNIDLYLTPCCYGKHIKSVKESPHDTVAITFDDFLKYYDLNPGRYTCNLYRVKVSDQGTFRFIIRFNYHNYSRYRKWYRRRTESDKRMRQNEKTAAATIDYIKIVQSDINRCRSEWESTVNKIADTYYIQDSKES